VTGPRSERTRAWEEVVTVREDAELERELQDRWGRASGRRSVGVTDLLSLRRAYYRAVLPPVPIPPARQARLDQGRAVHRALGVRMAREGTLEARVRRDGLVGRIDILGELPIEVKTATSLVDPASLAKQRPDHLEQLGMYCALVGRPSGRLLTLLAEEGNVTEVQALDVTFGSVDRILAEMRRRADALRTAWADRNVASLPRCPWFGRGCEFEEAGRCSCTGSEPAGGSGVLDEAGPVVPNPSVAERIRSVFPGPVPSGPAPTLLRFRDALYPRRAYFERTRPLPEAPPTFEETPPTIVPDLFSRVSEALECGPPGEVARLVPRSEEPEEEVAGFRGRPLLVRTSRAWSRFRPEDLVARSPQYALELGMRCAVTGTDSAVLVVGFERAEADRDRVQALELRFLSRTPFSRWLRGRSRALSTALQDGAPASLTACPEWMVSDCPYRAECGCGASSSRVTR